MRHSCGFQALIVGAAVAQIAACGDASGPKVGAPASIVVVAGDGQSSPEVGTKLPLPLAVRVTGAQNQSLSGVTVVWSTSFGTLSAPTSLTSLDGVATIEWTLGTLSGNQTATATVTGISPVTFTERAVAGPISQIILTRDTVELLGVGDVFRLTARPTDRFGNSVSGGSTVESSDTSIVTAENFGNGAILTARASNATTTVRATAGSVVKTGTVVILPPPCRPGSSALNLGVGEVTMLSGTAASEFCMQGTATGAEFTAVPFFSDLNGSLLRLSISTGQTTIAVSPTLLAAPNFQLRLASKPNQPVRDEGFEAELRERSNRELTPLIPAARVARQQSGGAFNLSVAAQQVGDLLQLNTNSSSACANAFIRTGRVAAITDHAIVVADTSNPASGFTSEDYRHIGVTFDTLVYPVDTLNFGAPTDVDGNQHVILFFTRAVNELTPPNQSFYVAGFFYSRDLFPKTVSGNISACAASNLAEMFYLLVPDPAGVVNQNQRTVDFVRGVTIGTLAHEFQHLINASRHLYVNGSTSFEDVFLDEGLAHMAEELIFYRASGLAPGQNITFPTIQSPQKVLDAFNSFGIANIRRYREYLFSPSTNSPYADNANVTTRGATWSFLRYAADRRGGNENAMWFQLANPLAGVHGIANLTRVLGSDLVSWIRDWATANYADDFVSGVQSVDTHPSWSFRSLITTMYEGQFPLTTQQLDSNSITSVVISDGSADYLRFGVAPGAIGGGRMTARGAPVPAGFSLSILRTK